jgi:hypothetical protein
LANEQGTLICHRPAASRRPWNGTFAADITLDGEGIVLDYPDIARRL